MEKDGHRPGLETRETWGTWPSMAKLIVFNRRFRAGNRYRCR